MLKAVLTVVVGNLFFLMRKEGMESAARWGGRAEGGDRVGGQAAVSGTAVLRDPGRRGGARRAGMHEQQAHTVMLCPARLWLEQRPALPFSLL